ncbi:hypothetical protein [Pseudomarimonas arenosa]|uniref:DUF2381 family protein n=1 Tax=Pseudomarimonas arenosa TaxID=2774145 RepID=A0AAW3ZR97_9GAMM|nr:hypothetical protein [Pseudomarimonas arenosa]MBD8528233.1 hypothetical protein [Pseudomarimonas arenosa]
MLRSLFGGLIMLHGGMAEATEVDQLALSSRLIFLPQIDLPAGQESVLLFDADVEVEQEAPQRIVCQLKFSQSERARRLAGGSEFLITAAGIEAESTVPGQQESTSAVLRLVQSESSEVVVELRMSDTGGAEAEPSFAAELWSRRCRFRLVEPAESAG